MSYEIKMCACGRRTVQARNLCSTCYKVWWLGNKLTHIPHGERTGYVYGCRCALCTEADRAYKREWRARKRAEG